MYHHKLNLYLIKKSVLWIVQKVIFIAAKCKANVSTKISTKQISVFVKKVLAIKHMFLNWMVFWKKSKHTFRKCLAQLCETEFNWMKPLTKALKKIERSNRGNFNRSSAMKKYQGIQTKFRMAQYNFSEMGIIFRCYINKILVKFVWSLLT